ncbi:unnamed protein product [Durusdinium trenchii]|uniref:Uncharacterized protein n=1 Tax=Durusdinium trenchii TaxID=1381693 RepID=A0ABP0MIA4_9DINO
MSEVDVRAMHWYSHYRHSVFTMIQSCFEDDGASGVVMIGIQPGLERVMTCLEWPCIQQDLKSAFDEKKAPFYDKGKQLLDFRKINFKRICLEDLSDELDVSTKKNKFAIIASCSDDNFEAVKELMQAHNRSTPEGHGKVRKAWATAEDVYGGRSHPPKAGGYAAQAPPTTQAPPRATVEPAEPAERAAGADEQADKAEAAKCSDIFEAVRGSKLGALRHLVREDPAALQKTDSTGDAPAKAATYGQFLLKARAEVDAKNKEGLGPLKNASNGACGARTAGIAHLTLLCLRLCCGMNILIRCGAVASMPEFDCAVTRINEAKHHLILPV